MDCQLGTKGKSKGGAKLSVAAEVHCKDGAVLNDVGLQRTHHGSPAAHAGTRVEAKQELEGIPFSNEEREKYGKLHALVYSVKISIKFNLIQVLLIL